MVKAAIANAAWGIASTPSYVAFRSALMTPARQQERILKRIIASNVDSAFGREHRFREIQTLSDFAARVPVRDYDEFSPWIHRIREGESRVLTTEPIRRLVPTSGSVAARKLIPYTASMQRELNRAIGPWICDLYRQLPSTLGGPAYWSVSPLAQSEDSVQSAVPIGFDDDAEYLGGWRKPLVDAAMAVPSGVRRISTIEDWRYVTLLLLLRTRNLRLISVWHPSFFELLFEAMAENWHRLIVDIANGTCADLADLPANIKHLVTARAAPHRAAELDRMGPTSASEFWPRLAMISCWADGHTAQAASALGENLAVEIQPKGLLATEGVISIPFAGLHPLAIRSHYYEFEDDSGSMFLASELRVDANYHVLLTTGGGLYRYRLNDIVKVQGMVGRTPSIRFVGKASLVSDRFGEKLNEGFVAAVLDQLFQSKSTRPAFAMLAPDVDEKGVRYVLYADAELCPDFVAMIDDALHENPHYAYCRQLGQLRPPQLYRVLGDAYAQFCNYHIRMGRRLGDIKPTSLSCIDVWSSVFSGAMLD